MSRIIVVRADDRLRLRHLGGFPTPMLMDLCSDGKPHEAWPYYGLSADQTEPQWRARDDVFDAAHKPADVPYTLVLVGLDPREDEP